MTLIPLASASQLRMAIASDETYELQAFDGSTSLAPVVRLDTRFLSYTFRGRFLLIDQAWGIIGRDVLNFVSLLFDGPDLSWSEQRSGSRSSTSGRS